MRKPAVYVALQQFCESDHRPLALLQEAGCVVRLNTLGRRLRRDEMASVLQGAEGVLAGIEPYEAEVLARLPHLRCISRCGAGTDSIDLEAARRQGVAVYTTPDEAVEPVAQLTVGMILALARHLLWHNAEMHAGVWNKRTGFLLSEWTIGLVGFGRIGQAVERHLRGFGPRMLIADPCLDAQHLPAGVERRTLQSLLAEADLVSLHAARREQEGPLLGREELDRMKRGSYLVNTARGFLVDEQVLYEKLRSGHLAGAAVDAFQREPYHGPIAHLPNVVCTPHIATLTRASRAAMEWRCAQNLVKHFTLPQLHNSNKLSVRRVSKRMKPEDVKSVEASAASWNVSQGAERPRGLRHQR